MKFFGLRAIALVLLSLITGAPGEVVINELMYHPFSELPAEEFVELLNLGAQPVDLTGWRITNGVQFTFPAVVLPAGGYLVVAANAASFQAKYPGVTNYVAGWSGQLSNSGNHLVLKDAAGTKVDEVTYADDGDWAVRQKDSVLDHGHRGWGWESAADAGGESLELINARFDNDIGQNWLPSMVAQGTPGRVNSVAAADIAPVVTEMAHFPLVPKSTDPVTVTARVVDDAAANITATLFSRNDGTASFSSTPMFDDGAHGDAAAGDGIYGAALPARANGTIVEFYVRAADAGGRVRTWPALALDENGVAGQYTNALYEVDNTTYAGAMPLYRVTMKAADRAELTQINANSPAISGVDQTLSHARMNATFISVDGTGSELRYQTGVRNRGHGSRSASPQSFNLAFSNDRKWKGRTALNFNSQYTYLQLFGSALARKAGLTAPESRQIQLRVNNADPTGGATGGPSYGFYVANEVQNSEFADHHFPLDSSGNIYSVRRQEEGTYQEGSLDYLPPSGLHGADPYRPVYSKQTNASEDDWNDLISLTQTLAKGRATSVTVTPTWDADYVAAVQAKVDVAQWMRWFAVETFLANNETNLSRGYGDDYYLYFGESDPRARLIPYDLDTILGKGDSVAAPDVSLFRMVMHASSQIGQLPTPLLPLLRHPSFAPLYFAALKEQLDGAFSVANFSAFADQILTGVMDQAHIAALKTWHAQRHAYISAQIPMTLTVTGTPAVDTVSGYPKTASATTSLTGRANPITTRSVKINGVNATYQPFRITGTITNPDDDVAAVVGEWTLGSVALKPGVNRLLIQAFDGAGVETERTFQNVWYEDGSVVSTSGALTANTVWTAAGGPYQITAALTVNNGVTLTIQPGTTVYLASGVGITVAAGGRILAEGTETAPIRFTRAPGSSGTAARLPSMA